MCASWWLTNNETKLFSCVDINFELGKKQIPFLLSKGLRLSSDASACLVQIKSFWNYVTNLLFLLHKNFYISISLYFYLQIYSFYLKFSVWSLYRRSGRRALLSSCCCAHASSGAAQVCGMYAVSSPVPVVIHDIGSETSWPPHSYVHDSILLFLTTFPRRLCKWELQGYRGEPTQCLDSVISEWLGQTFSSFFLNSHSFTFFTDPFHRTFQATISLFLSDTELFPPLPWTFH